MIKLKVNENNQLKVRGNDIDYLVIDQNDIWIIDHYQNMIEGNVLDLPIRGRMLKINVRDIIQDYNLSEAQVADQMLNNPEFVPTYKMSLVETNYLLSLINLDPSDAINYISPKNEDNVENYLYDKSSAYEETFKRLGGKGLKFRFVGNVNYQFTWKLSDHVTATSLNGSSFEEFAARLLCLDIG